MDFWRFSSSSNEIRTELCGIFLPFQGYENVSWNIFQIFFAARCRRCEGDAS